MSGTEFSIDIPEQHFEKLMFLCNEGRKDSSEVSGYACVQFDGKTFTIGEPYMCKHTGSAAETETDPEGHGKLMYKMFKESQEAKEQGIELHPNKLHWHTHPNMGVFWSGTDVNLIRQLGSNGWMIYLVLNEKREVKGAFYQIVEVMGNKHEIFLDDVPVNILYEVDESLHTAWAAEFKDAHQKKHYAPPLHRPAYLGGRGTSHQSTSPAYNNWHNQFGIYEGWSEYGGWGYGDDEEDEIQPIGNRYDPPTEYDSHGFKKQGGDWIYNPLKDKTCTTDLQRVEELYHNMEDGDIAELARTDEEFNRWFLKVRAAGLGGANV